MVGTSHRISLIDGCEFKKNNYEQIFDIFSLKVNQQMSLIIVITCKMSEYH